MYRFLFAFFTFALSSLIPVEVTNFTLHNTAVIDIAENLPGTTGLTLFSAGFGTDFSDNVLWVKNLENVFDADFKPIAETYTRHVKWPNYIEHVDKEIFGRNNIVLTAGGFFLPFQSPGRIKLWTDVDQATQISTDVSGMFYHKTVWADMNGDGRKDLLAARTNFPSFGSKVQHLVWFEHPAVGALTHSWVEHSIINNTVGCDFEIVNLGPEGSLQIIATQFFTASDPKQVLLLSCNKTDWSQCGESDFTRTVIDDTLGPWFSLEWVDINMDGKEDLLVTNNRPDDKGKVFVFEVPEDYLNDPWPKHIVAEGYAPPSSILPGKGAPGKARSFYPEKAQEGKTKPWIQLTGDDMGCLDLLIPNSEDANDWNYTRNRIIEDVGTIGSPITYDLNNDGITELLVPLNAKSLLSVWTFVSADEPLEKSGSTCSLYEISSDSLTCGQSDLDCKYAPYAKKFQSGLKDGTCASQGYSEYVSSQTKSFPVIGKIVITTYKKPARERKQLKL